MSYNGSGTFNINSAGQPVVTGTVISSTAFNALTADLGTGLSTALTKDGQTVATARIPFAAGINSSLVTDATNTTTGSIITAGGVGIAKALYVGTTLNVAGASTLAAITGTFNGTVGATTPAAGTFNALTVSSTQGTQTITSTTAAQASYLLLRNTADSSNSYVYAPNKQIGIVQADTSGSSVVYFSTQNTERMRIDSSGNVGIGTTSPASQASILQVSSGSSASAALSTQGLRLTDNGGNARSIGMYDANATLGFANGTNIAFLTAGGSWQNSSDRNLKENFIALDKQTALNKIAELPIMQWNYKIEPATSLHIGPIAQDFYAAFGVGGINGETSISTIDPAGVALLGIQALIEKVDAQAIIITALTDRIAALEAKA